MRRLPAKNKDKSAISLPKGGGAIKGIGETFKADIFTGTGNFSVPIFMDANGGYHDFGRFLNQLETEEICLSVTDFSIASRQADKSHHAIKMTLDAIIFEGIQ